MSGNSIQCCICNKTASSSTSWSRWNLHFCSRKCYDQQANIEKSKQEERDRIEASKVTHKFASYSSGYGGCY